MNLLEIDFQKNNSSVEITKMSEMLHDADIPFKWKGITPLIQLPYRDLMIWLGAMDLVIGHDSGILHLAAAIGTRTYGIFGPTDPQTILGMYGSHVSWNKLVYLLKKAKIIVAAEGGIVHLAFAAGASNVVVLGGPTQGVLFEYPGHKWINSYVCGNCWSTTLDWYERCPKDCDAVCMKTISPRRVVDAVLEKI